MTYLQLINAINAFATKHKEIKRFASDFLEQFGNYSTEGNSFPILYAVPDSTSFSVDLYTDLNDFTLTFYSVDLIQEDRANINTILNTTNLILNDLHKFFRDDLDDLGVDILTVSNAIPVNNYLMDNVAGWSMTVTFQLETYSTCDIPLD
jgi:hypothetical protein